MKLQRPHWLTSFRVDSKYSLPWPDTPDFSGIRSCSWLCWRSPIHSSDAISRRTSSLSPIPGKYSKYHTPIPGKYSKYHTHEPAPCLRYLSNTANITHTNQFLVSDTWQIQQISHTDTWQISHTRTSSLSPIPGKYSKYHTPIPGKYSKYHIPIPDIYSKYHTHEPVPCHRYLTFKNIQILLV